MAQDASQTVEPWAQVAAWMAAVPQPGAVLWIGAGAGTDLAEALALPSPRIILVEPDPEAVRHLRRAAQTDTRIEVIPQAVAMEAGHRALHVFNIRQMSSLRPVVAAAQAGFPGLREIAAPQVETVTLPHLLDALALETDAAHLLVLEAAGEEATILDALEAADLAGRFSWLLLRAPAEACHEGARTVEELLRTAHARGWAQQGHDAADPAFPLTLLRFDKRALDLRRSDAARQAAEAEARRLTAETARLSSELARARSAAAERGRLTEEIADLQARLAEATTAHATLEQRQTAERAAEARLEAELATLRQSHAQIAADRDALVARLDTAEAEATALTARLATAETRAAEAEANHAARQQDLSTALQLQASAQTDLRDLRDRYAALQTAQARAETLIAELAAQLDTAAQHLHALPASAGSPIAAAAVDAVPVAPWEANGPKAKKAKKHKKKMAKGGDGA